MKETLEKLDEKGFVFIGNDQKPYWCRTYDKEAWLLWWHPDKKWVTKRKVSQSEVWLFNEGALPNEEAQLYHNLAFPTVKAR